MSLHYKVHQAKESLDDFKKHLNKMKKMVDGLSGSEGTLYEATWNSGETEVIRFKSCFLKEEDSKDSGFVEAQSFFITLGIKIPYFFRLSIHYDLVASSENHGGQYSYNVHQQTEETDG